MTSYVESYGVYIFFLKVQYIRRCMMSPSEVPHLAFIYDESKDATPQVCAHVFDCTFHLVVRACMCTTVYVCCCGRNTISVRTRNHPCIPYLNMGPHTTSHH